jgi:monothiol glutaredoxin
MSDTALRAKIKETIESEPVVLFMKGTPERISCGNSARALDALRAVGAPVTAVDILPDPSIRHELSALSNWPTIPQVFVCGELVGGADIVQELAETGALSATLDAKLGDGWRDSGQPRVVAVSERRNPLGFASPS